MSFNPQNLDCDVLVLGAGISGLSTALALQARGKNVAIVSETFPLKNSSEPLVSKVPTNYAMASAYPHYLRVKNLEAISDLTQSVFKNLCDNTNSGVLKYRIFEVFEYEPGGAPLRSRRMNFNTFDGKLSALSDSVNPPARPNADYIWGWHFDSYFCDMPDYMPYLWSVFESNGGEVFKAKLTKGLLEEIPGGVVMVNCLGVGSLQLFNDPLPVNIQRGCQILISGAPVISNEEGIPISYNYYPKKDVFPRNSDEAEYLHFFPRHDGWLLGQTREPGQLDEQGKWVGDTVIGTKIDIDGVVIPKAILELNLEIIQNWCMQEVDVAKLIPRIGYRYYRDRDNHGVRLEKGNGFGNSVIHNYAHGGSGITMSWGCAVKAASLCIDGSGAEFTVDNQMGHVEKLAELLTG